MKAKTTIQQELTVHKRTALGTRPIRRLRQTAVVPGIVYGKAMEPLAITIEHTALSKLLHSKGGEHALVKLRLADNASWERAALVKTVQHDPVDGHVIHIDFHAIALTEQIKVKIPVILKGDPVGVKQDGGILEQFLREIEVSCLPTEIPDGVEFDISAMTIGETIHVSQLLPPKSAKILTDMQGVIASVQEPKVEKIEVEAAAVTEPEVLREKKEKEEEGAQAPGGETKGAAPEAKKDAKAEK